MKKRFEEIDLLRGLAVMAALPVHFDAIYQTTLTQSFIWFNRLYLNIAIVFFLVAGFMGKKVYAKKLEKNFVENRRKLWIKGLQIMGIYIVVTVFLIIIGGGEVTSLSQLMLTHTYFLKVYVPFSVMYLISPYVIRGLENVSNEWVVLGIGLGMVWLTEPMSNIVNLGIWEPLVIDYDPYLHPLWPMLGVYVIGNFLARIYEKLRKSTAAFYVSVAVVLGYYHVILRYVAEQVGFTETNILVLKIMIVVAILVSLGFIVRSGSNICRKWWRWALVPGKGSLVFFTSINVLVPIIKIFGWVNATNAMWLMAGVFGLSYGLSYALVKR